MSDTQERTNTEGAGEDTQDSGVHDPSDPNAAAEAIRRDLAASEARYTQTLRRAREAEAGRADATQRLETVTQDRDGLEFSTVSNALDAATATAASLQRDYTAAMEAGDFAKAGQLSLEIGRTGAKMETLENGKAELDRRRQEALRAPPRPDPTRQTAEGDPIEADLAKRTPEAAAWLRRQTDATGKPRFFTDPTFHNRVVGAHSLALADGHRVDTPEYFAYVEKVAGVNQPSNTRQDDPPARRDGGRVPAAAPTRPASSYSGREQRPAGNHIPEEAAKYARDVLKVDPVAYWKEVQEMDRRGEFKLGNPWRGRA